MDEIPPGAARPRRDFHGRRHGKALRPNQRRHLAELLPRIAVPLDPAPIDLEALFGGARPVWLEIGFGGGEHLVHQALKNPGVGLIGCEAFVNGVAMALNQIEEAEIEPAGIKRAADRPLGPGAAPKGNVRLHAGDARDLLDALPDACLARVFLLYPDPWPKARHARRRFTSVENLTLLARVMKPDAELRVATDIPDYVAHTRESIGAVPELFVTAGRDALQPWQDWFRTRYEAKAIREGREPGYLTFTRRA